MLELYFGQSAVSVGFDDAVGSGELLRHLIEFVQSRHLFFHYMPYIFCVGVLDEQIKHVFLVVKVFISIENSVHRSSLNYHQVTFRFVFISFPFLFLYSLSTL